MISAASSASALSLRCSSRSSAAMRFASVDVDDDERLVVAARPFVASSRHCVSVASCTPSRRRYSPSSLSASFDDSTRIRSLSATVHCFLALRFLFVMSTWLVASEERPAARASRSQRDRVGCPIPTSRARATAEIRAGPAMRRTSRAFSPWEYIIFDLCPREFGEPLLASCELLRSGTAACVERLAASVGDVGDGGSWAHAAWAASPPSLGPVRGDDAVSAGFSRQRPGRYQARLEGRGGG